MASSRLALRACVFLKWLKMVFISFWACFFVLNRISVSVIGDREDRFLTITHLRFNHLAE